MSAREYLKLEKVIAADERDGVINRWRYGRELLKAKSGRAQLPHGLAGDLVKGAEKAGLKLSEREIRYRLRCAEVYATEREVGTAVQTFGSWTALREAGFPSFEVDEAEPEADEAETADEPEEFEQLALIPGAPEVLRIRGRSVKLIDATVSEFKAYCEQSSEMTANFAKRDAQLWAAYDRMREATENPGANALEAYLAADASSESAA